MSLWEYANPVKFLRLSGKVLPWISILAAVLLVSGLVWGFFFTPDDYRQGSTVTTLWIIKLNYNWRDNKCLSS